MPIQFHCEGCGQPIEVDDDAAHQPVTCPYCRRTGTAPAATPPGFDPRPRTAPAGPARPVTSATPIGGHPASNVATMGPSPMSGNRMAFLALGLMALAALLMIPATMMSAPIIKDVETIQDPVERSKALNAELIKHPALIVMNMLSMCVLPLVALVLAIVSLVRKSTPRWPAYTTLGLVGGGILMMCLGTLAQVLGGGV